MKTTLALTSVLLIMLCTGCSDTHEKLAGESVSTTKELVATLDGVKDEASATAAKSKLTSLMDQLKKLNERQMKLPAPTEDEIKSMESKYGKEMEELNRKLQAHMMRIMVDPKIAAVLQGIDMNSK